MKYPIWLAAATLSLAACGREATAPPAIDGAGSPRFGLEANPTGHVYTLSNDPQSNAVLTFVRASDGSLTPAAAYPTAGKGTGAGLGSQGSIILSDDGRWLFAVNAGSDQVTSFGVVGGTLSRVTTVSSGGSHPISLTWRRGLLYVLNDGGSGNITGFRVASDGSLQPIANSTRPLSSGAAGPAEVGFGPQGRLLVVTEKNTNVITTYLINAAGVPSGPIVNASAGQEPFGFSFDPSGLLIVAEAFGGAPNGSAASSYRVRDDGTLQVVSASIPTHQTAACWFAVTHNGRFAYTTDAGSAVVSGYSVASGHLALIDPSGSSGSTGTAPTNAAVTSGSAFLYTLNSGSHTISAFQVGGGGALVPLTGASGLPAGTIGLAAW